MENKEYYDLTKEERKNQDKIDAKKTEKKNNFIYGIIVEVMVGDKWAV